MCYETIPEQPSTRANLGRVKHVDCTSDSCRYRKLPGAYRVRDYLTKQSTRNRERAGLAERAKSEREGLSEGIHCPTAHPSDELTTELEIRVCLIGSMQRIRKIVACQLCCHEEVPQIRKDCAGRGRGPHLLDAWCLAQSLNILVSRATRTHFLVAREAWRNQG